jgi:hypothetical protein
MSVLADGSDNELPKTSVQKTDSGKKAPPAQVQLS